jgi:hypothetical protein
MLSFGLFTHKHTHTDTHKLDLKSDDDEKAAFTAFAAFACLIVDLWLTEAQKSREKAGKGKRRWSSRLEKEKGQ